MVCVKTLSRRNIDSLTRKIPYWRMPIRIRIVGLPRELLSIICRRQKEDQILAKKGLIVRKREGL
jgi:hypothetical protein